MSCEVRFDAFSNWYLVMSHSDEEHYTEGDIEKVPTTNKQIGLGTGIDTTPGGPPNIQYVFPQQVLNFEIWVPGDAPQINYDLYALRNRVINSGLLYVRIGGSGGTEFTLDLENSLVNQGIGRSQFEAYKGQPGARVPVRVVPELANVEYEDSAGNIALHLI